MKIRKTSSPLTLLFALAVTQMCTLVPQFQEVVAVFIIIGHILLGVYLWDVLS